MRGKPWTTGEERELRTLIEDKTPMEAIAEKLGRNPTAIYVKCLRLGLTDKPNTTPSSVPLPEDLPSVEEALQMLAAALKKASKPGIDKGELKRLQVVGTLAKTYKEIFADYLDYRGLEIRLVELEAKYKALTKGMPESVAPIQKRDKMLRPTLTGQVNNQESTP